MSEIIKKDDGSPFATAESAKSKRTRMGEEGLDTIIIKVDGGFVLEKKEYDKPKKRIPLGVRNVLSVNKSKLDTENYRYRVVNDDRDRIERFRDAGWEVVRKSDAGELGDPQVGTGGGNAGSLVTKTVGKEMIGYLMRIKKEYYEEDQEAKAKKIRQTESDLKMEKEKNEKRQGKFYGDIKIGERQH